jgi:thioredoxin-like negative regulator of GroEL
MLAREPEDVFLHFSLAMELVAGGQEDEGLKAFDQVIALDPDYVAAYHRKADLLIRADRADEARVTLTAGVEAATRKADNHMRQTMSDMLARLPV